MPIEIRAITPDEVEAFRTIMSQTFGGDFRDDPEGRFGQLIDLGRTYAAFDDTTMVGTAGAFDFTLSVPGGEVPMAGLTMVSVRPTHRRMGILRQMIDAHFADVLDRGEPLSGLWASETPIYRRFGYGDSVGKLSIEIDSARAGVAEGDPAVVIRMLDADAAADVVPDVYERRRFDRAGMLSRSEPWWRLRRLADHEWMREGASGRRYAVAYRDGVAIGYALFRQKEKWDDWLPAGEISVIEIIGDVAAQNALWGFLSRIDLFPTITWWNAPVDDPILWRAANTRAITAKQGDSLWLRIMDVAGALEKRSYRGPGEVAMRVSDTTLPSNDGVHHLGVDDAGSATCTRSDGSPDVAMDIAALGALYLGGRSAVQLAAAGHIDGDIEAVRRLDELMGWDPPWCPEVF